MGSYEERSIDNSAVALIALSITAQARNVAPWRAFLPVAMDLPNEARHRNHRGSIRGSEGKITGSALKTTECWRWGQSSANSSLFGLFPVFAGIYREIYRIQTQDDD